MNLKVGETRARRVGQYEEYREIERHLMRKYQEMVDLALENSLGFIGIKPSDLKPGEIIMLPSANFTDYFYKQTPLFRLHSRPNLLKFGGWEIQYFNKNE